MQGIFQKENTDKALKYGIYRHLPTYEKIIRNLVSFYNTKGCNTLNGWYAYKYTDGSVKNMTLKKSSTIICLTIQLLLNIICMILAYSYVIKIKIPVELDVEFPIDLYFSFAGYLLLLLLIVFNIITIICIVSEIINLKNKIQIILLSKE